MAVVHEVAVHFHYTDYLSFVSHTHHYRTAGIGTEVLFAGMDVMT